MFKDLTHQGILHRPAAVFLLLVTLLILGTHDFVFAQKKATIGTTKQDKCIPGKGPPPNSRPMTKCWSGKAADVSSVAEDGKSKYTNNHVSIGLDGKMTVCSWPVPQDKNCKPVGPGVITYCNSLSGQERCEYLLKDEAAGKKMSDSLGYLAKKSLDPDLQRDIAAQSMAAAARKMLTTPLAGTSFHDQNCILVSCRSEQPMHAAGARIVTLSKDELERIANSSEFSQNMQNWATALQIEKLPPQLPIGFASDPQFTSDASLVKKYFTDTGNEVRLYSSQPLPVESRTPNYYGTGTNIPAPSGDTTFRAPPPLSVPLAPVAPPSSFQSTSWSSWMTSAVQAARQWLRI